MGPRINSHILDKLLYALLLEYKVTTRHRRNRLILLSFKKFCWSLKTCHRGKNPVADSLSFVCICDGFALILLFTPYFEYMIYSISVICIQLNSHQEGETKNYAHFLRNVKLSQWLVYMNISQNIQIFV
jgi:hypothetical protein